METKSPQLLPIVPQQRQQLINRIQKEIVRLQSEIKENAQDSKLVRQNEQHIQMLRLRNILIGRCGELSLLRLSHLQEVFKHYCIHVFRTGKHMTFDRLEYEKVHMTMERFFLFLKDFKLTVTQIDGKNSQILQKQGLIAIFKKVSSTSRQLSFQEFIQCIQKLAVLFWDQKLCYTKKQEQARLKMQKIKAANEKRRKKKMGLKSQGQVQKDKQQEKQQEKIDSRQEEPNNNNKKYNVSPPNIQTNQNDDLIDELMKNQDIQDPNQQVRQVAEKAKKQNAAVQSVIKKQHQQFRSLLKLSNQQKIEYYYELIDIDSVDSYKNKLTQLNLQTYIDHHQQPHQAVKALSESKLQAAMQQQEQRLQKLKAKMNQKKQKMKDRPLPKPSNQRALKEQENSRKRRQMKKQRQNAVKELKVEQVKKVELKAKNITPKVQYKEGQVSWQMLGGLGIQNLKMKQFNIARYYAPQDDDRYFLQQYGAKPRITSGMQARERQSLSIVESTKMRASQLQKKERQKGGETARRPSKQNNTSFSRNKI